MTPFEKQLKKLFKRYAKERAIKPDEKWLKSSRQHLERAIQTPAGKHAKQRAHGIFKNLVIKPLAASLVVILVIAVIGGGTVMAAQGSTPDQPLYPLKLAGEKFNILVATSPEAKARLYLKYADRRLGELEKLYTKDANQAVWEERLVQSLGGHMAGTKEQLAKLDKSPQYADIALEFEELTDEHGRRFSLLRAKLNTSTAVFIRRAQMVNELNRQRALEALDHAHTMMREQDEGLQIMEQRIQKRLEYIKQRRANQNLDSDMLLRPMFLEATTPLPGPEGINALHLEADDNDDGGGVNEIKLDDASGNKIDIYEEEITDDGVHVESRIEIGGEGEEEVETEININDGQVIFKSRTEATGDSIEIRETSTIHATSSFEVKIEEQNINY